ncbi:hypothetical protein [Neomoorella thermoacetica]|uniref:hypothetical protein n=1 Tax=Neomoorella thermoacetica TaxID=1525 RepID=UPI0008FA1695|nr:hypothetical protein [Moorella thermoacetica]
MVLTLIFKLLLAMDFYQSLVASLTILAPLVAIEILLLLLETSSLGLSRFSEAWPRPSLHHSYGSAGVGDFGPDYL